MERFEPNLRATGQSLLSRGYHSGIVALMHFLQSLQSFTLRPRAPDAYDDAKAAQIAAFFVLKEGGAVDILKLAKLMYLAERESFARYAAPLTGDRLSSMKDGPVLSETLNYILGHGRPPEVWRSLFNTRDGNSLRLQQADLSEDALLRLSEADIALLEDVWRKFGHMSSLEIWGYVHTNLPEYEDPGTSSRPIKMELLLGTIGYSEEQIKEILERIE